MDAVKFLKEFRRMCTGIDDCQHCVVTESGKKCPYEFQLWEDIYDALADAVDLIEQWSKEHPRKTYLDDFKEKFPKADTKWWLSMPCRKHLYTGVYHCRDGHECERCWNTPMEDDA